MPTTNDQPLRIIPLGGVGEIGKNMYVFEYGDEIVVIDCGLMFPEEEMFGVDFVVPDVKHLRARREKVKALLITRPPARALPPRSPRPPVCTWRSGWGPWRGCAGESRPEGGAAAFETVLGRL